MKWHEIDDTDRKMFLACRGFFDLNETYKELYSDEENEEMRDAYICDILIEMMWKSHKKQNPDYNPFCGIMANCVCPRGYYLSEHGLNAKNLKFILKEKVRNVDFYIWNDGYENPRDMAIKQFGYIEK